MIKYSLTLIIGIDEVRLAIKHFKKCKYNCIDDIFSDNFINGTELVCFLIFLCYLA